MKKYAGFWQRLAAAFIDSLIFAFPGWHFGYFVPFAVLNIAYHVWMNGTYGATIGKMVLKIKITKENGGKITYSDALLRVLASYLSSLAFGLGYFWMLWDKKKQTWHDHIAKTVVVKA